MTNVPFDAAHLLPVIFFIFIAEHLARSSGSESSSKGRSS
jgi:hypothetical protein